jgi:hypothetical protein
MVPRTSVEIPRRQFLAAGGLTVAAACLAPRGLFAQEDDLPEHAFKVAATAKRAAEENLATVTDKMIVIPGHGDVGAKADLKLFRDVMVDLREKVAALKKQGRSLAEVIADKPGTRTDDEWGNGFMTPALFLEWVYQGV